MNTALYILIFAIGALCGSFLTLATYRIPLHKDITHEHSFCPKCNHKLSFFDLIPILSYVFLGGKCRYCKNKISSRYFIIEILTGTAFVVLARILNINIFTITTNQCIEFLLYGLYIIFLYLVAGIDIKHKKINKGVIIFGFCIACINIIYQYIQATNEGVRYNLNRIIIYLVLIIILMIFNIESFRKTKKFDYCIDLELISIIMCIFTFEITTILSIIGCLIASATRLLLNKIFNKGKEESFQKIPMGLYLVASNLVVFMILYLFTLNT